MTSACFGVPTVDRATRHGLWPGLEQPPGAVFLLRQGPSLGPPDARGRAAAHAVHLEEDHAHVARLQDDDRLPRGRVEAVARPRHRRDHRCCVPLHSVERVPLAVV